MMECGRCDAAFLGLDDLNVAFCARCWEEMEMKRIGYLNQLRAEIERLREACEALLACEEKRKRLGDRGKEVLLELPPNRLLYCVAVEKAQAALRGEGKDGTD